MLSKEWIQRVPDCLTVFVMKVLARDSPQRKSFRKLRIIMLDKMGPGVGTQLTFTLSRLVFNDVAHLKYEWFKVDVRTTAVTTDTMTSGFS